jgi:hypothetical protein
MLDCDLAKLYQVETGALNRAMTKTADTTGRGGRRYMPYAFTEQGISMLSAVLHSDVNT